MGRQQRQQFGGIVDLPERYLRSDQPRVGTHLVRLRLAGLGAAEAFRSVEVTTPRSVNQ